MYEGKTSSKNVAKAKYFATILKNTIFFMEQQRKEYIYKMISIIILKVSSRLPAKKR